MYDLSEQVTEYWEEHGFSKETTMCILRDIKEALCEQAISVEITIEEDANDYEKQNKDE